MASSVAIGAGAIVATAVLNPIALPMALLLGGLWIAAPWIMHLASVPLETEDRLMLDPEDGRNCAASRGSHGGSSTISSAPTRTTCRPTTFS